MRKSEDLEDRSRPRAARKATRRPKKTVAVPPFKAKANGNGNGAVIHKLGERVRALRLERQWTLEELAVRSRVSRSSLSKIERDEVSPTYDVIQRVAQGFNVPVVEFFSAAQSPQVIARRTVSKADELEIHQGRGYLYQLLCNELSTKKMLPYLATIKARSIEEAGGYVHHSGEEFLFVLSGQITFFTEHYAPVALDPGDSIYIDSHMGHACVSRSKTSAKVLWIVTET